MGKHPRGAGYEVHAEIPFAAVGLPQGQKEFLFDAIVRLTALGDAHSGGATSLSGSTDSHHNSSRFAQVLAI
jgi:hypothetical protein